MREVSDLQYLKLLRLPSIAPMKIFRLTDSVFSAYWIGWRRWLALSICITAIPLLGVLRVATDALFVVASLALFPVLVITWVSGKKIGLLAALLAAIMWLASDIASGRQFSAAWIPWANAATHLMTYSVVALLTDRVRELLERARQLSTSDALTGLQNRRGFLEAGAAEVKRAMRYSHSVAVMYLDLDDFKKLNDTQGHDIGDAALRATATALLSVLRSSDKVARIGGDEFAILLPEIQHAAAIEAGQKISSAITNALKGFSPVTGSIGLVWFDKADRSFVAMLKAADELMYEVKKRGKGYLLSRRAEAMSESAKSAVLEQ